MSTVEPMRCTGITARVRGPIAASTRSAVIRCVSGSTSTSRGVAPARLTASAVAMNEFVGTMTSSPGPMLERAQREHERLGAGGDADGVRRSRSRRRTRASKASSSAPIVKAPVRGDARDDLEQLLEQRGVGLVEPGDRDRRSSAGRGVMRPRRDLGGRSGRSRARRARRAARRGRGGAGRGSTARSCRARSAISPGDEADDVAQHDHLALVLGQRRERLAQADRASAARRSSVAALLELADLLARDRAALAHVVDGDVAGDPQDPRRERHGALLVLRQRRSSASRRRAA